MSRTRSVARVFRYVIQGGQERLDLLLESPRDAVQPFAEPGEPVSLELKSVDVAEHVPEREVFVQVRGERSARRIRAPESVPLARRSSPEYGTIATLTDSNSRQDP